MMGDGGFWHNGLTSGVANAVFNRSDNLTIVVDNNYTSATGGQDILSSKATNATRSTGHAIEQAVRGVGVKWVKTMRRTYDVAGMRDALQRGADDDREGPEGADRAVGVHAQPAAPREAADAARRSRPASASCARRFGVDADTCTGDHSCIRLSGCPSLSIKPNPDPLRTDPVATVLDSCVGCGVCGEVSHAAVLCPSFYKAQHRQQPERLGPLRRARARRGDRLAAARAMRAGARAARVLRRTGVQADMSARAIEDRHPRDGRRRRRRAGRLDRRPRRAERLHRADDLGARRRAAHRRDDLLRRAVSRARRPSATAACRCSR